MFSVSVFFSSEASVEVVENLGGGARDWNYFVRDSCRRIWTCLVHESSDQGSTRSLKRSLLGLFAIGSDLFLYFSYRYVFIRGISSNIGFKMIVIYTLKCCI